MTSAKPTNGSEDAYRELIHEVRNLAAAVALLHTIFVKRTVLYWALGIETAIVAVALTVGGIFIAIENGHQNNLVDKAVGSCSIRNQQVDATKSFLTQEFIIQKESALLTAAYFKRLSVHLSPTETALAMKIQGDQNAALAKWYKDQPRDVDCTKIGSGTG